MSLCWLFIYLLWSWWSTWTSLANFKNVLFFLKSVFIQYFFWPLFEIVCFSSCPPHWWTELWPKPTVTGLHRLPRLHKQTTALQFHIDLLIHNLEWQLLKSSHVCMKRNQIRYMAVDKMNSLTRKNARK